MIRVDGTWVEVSEGLSLLRDYSWGYKIIVVKQDRTATAYNNITLIDINDNTMHLQSNITVAVYDIELNDIMMIDIVKQDIIAEEPIINFVV